MKKKDETKKTAKIIIERLSCESETVMYFENNKPSYTCKFREWSYAPTQLHVNEIIIEEITKLLAK